MPAAIALLLGLAILVGGAELMVHFGTLLARRLRISPIIIGLTIVSIGTSAPELAIGIDGIRRGTGSLVLGNILGTNVVNLMLILGLSAAIRSLVIRQRTLTLDLPAMVVSAVVLFVLASDGLLSRIDGAILLALALVYLAVTFFTTKRRTFAASEVSDDDDGPPPERTGRLIARDLVLLLVGIVVIVWGADLLLNGAVAVAEYFGISEAIVGLTIVAIGTSAPELATTLSATLHGKRSIAIGNLIGSSTLNLTFVLGTSLLVGAGADAVAVERSLLTVNLPIMVGVSLLCVPIFWSGRRVSRVEGALMVCGYAVYLGFLIIWTGLGNN